MNARIYGRVGLTGGLLLSHVFLSGCELLVQFDRSLIPDGGLSADGAPFQPPVDAATEATTDGSDNGTADASTQAEASTPADASTQADASAQADASTPTDASTPADASTQDNPTSPEGAPRGGDAIADVSLGDADASDDAD